MAAVGGNLTITCNPEAAPQPEITWLQNGHVIGYSDSRREILLDGTLHIHDVAQSDQGSYTCKATNVNGEDESRTQVTVLGKEYALYGITWYYTMWYHVKFK